MNYSNETARQFRRATCDEYEKKQLKKEKIDLIIDCSEFHCKV